MDWLKASTGERKALFAVMRQLIRREGLGWQDVYECAWGKMAGVGTDYESNFRQGRIARNRAHQLYAWMVRDYPRYALQLDDMLEGTQTLHEAGAAWRALLAAHGRYDSIEAVRLPDPLAGIVSFADPEPLAHPVIPLGAPFCFQVQSGNAAHALAFQTVQSKCYALPLRPDRLFDTVTAGSTYLPRLPDSQRPNPLSEEEQNCRHGFVFLLGGAALIEAVAARVHAEIAIAPLLLDEIAAIIRASDEDWRLLRINLLFQK